MTVFVVANVTTGTIVSLTDTKPALYAYYAANMGYGVLLLVGSAMVLHVTRMRTFERMSISNVSSSSLTVSNYVLAVESRIKELTIAMIALLSIYVITLVVYTAIGAANKLVPYIVSQTVFEAIVAVLHCFAMRFFRKFPKVDEIILSPVTSSPRQESSLLKSV
jgi:hypothetical protein